MHRYIQNSYYLLILYIQNRAGRTFNEFALIHSGIGLWHLDSEEKISIEFYSNSYVGSLFPNIDSSGALKWNNSGDVVVSNFDVYTYIENAL